MSSLPSPELLQILKRLNAAVGYLNLGMPQEAWNELEGIEPKDRARPEVLKVRVEGRVWGEWWWSWWNIGNNCSGSLRSAYFGYK